MKRALPLSQAEALAHSVIERLAPHCARLAIAGSLRRKTPIVGDIEIVCQPKFAADLFGVAVPLPIPTDSLGRHLVSGDRYRQILLPQGAVLDLFIVLPPAQWGVVLAIRTGSAAFSQKLVTHTPIGFLPREYLVRDGAVRSIATGEIIPTPEEEDFFRLCGLPFIPPTERN